MGKFADDIRKSAARGTGIFSWPKAFATNSYGGFELNPKVTHGIDPAQMKNLQLMGGLLILMLFFKK